MGLVANKVTPEYALWRAQRSKNLVMPPAVEGEPSEKIPQEGHLIWKLRSEYSRKKKRK